MALDDDENWPRIFSQKGGCLHKITKSVTRMAYPAVNAYILEIVMNELRRNQNFNFDLQIPPMLPNGT